MSHHRIFIYKLFYNLFILYTRDLDEILKNVSEQVITDAKETIIKHHLPEMNPAAVNTIRQQIMDIANPEHKVRAIVSKYSFIHLTTFLFLTYILEQRVREFYHNIIESSTANPQKVPSGLTALQEPLVAVAGQLLRIVSHNETVFCIYYHKIVAEALPKAS